MLNGKLTNSKIWEWIKSELWDFIKRHTLVLALAAVFIYLLAPKWNEIRVILLLGILETFAILMSGFAQWAYTKINFTKTRQNNILGYIFLGVHILFGLCIFGVYFVMFISP
ncbi:hypothetical protein D9V84_11160 [Bacteroidetes/Chlorobi group bacterium Naka2016]|jgi:hypothetical protein|nr:MAG: hypothetical protein D9V84_11160 [Bacteroidetes/Chlorobi group bacterium Naka2016]